MSVSNLTLFRENKLYGIKDAQGHVILPPTYEHIYNIDQEVLRVQHDGLWGVISREGKVIVPPTYTEMYGAFCNRIAVQGTNGQFGFIDFEGHVVIPFRYEDVGNFSGEEDGFEFPITYAKQEGSYGLIDAQGEVVLPFEYDYLSYLIEGHITAEQDGCYGLINQRGDVIIPFEYDDLTYESKRYVQVCQDEKYGYINLQNEVVIPLIYDEIDFFDFDVCAVCKKEKWNCVDRKGQLLFDQWYDEIIRVDQDTFVFRNGKRYSYRTSLTGPITACQQDKYGVYSEDGKVLMVLISSISPDITTCPEQIYVRKGIERLSHTTSEDPDSTTKCQLSLDVETITFAEGVTHIGTGWEDVWDDFSSKKDNTFDIYLPSTLKKVHTEAFLGCESHIGHIYVPHGCGGQIRYILPSHLTPYVQEMGFLRTLLHKLKILFG